MGARIAPDTHRQEENNGEKGGGHKEGHLGFYDVNLLDNGHGGGVDGSIRSPIELSHC